MPMPNHNDVALADSRQPPHKISAQPKLTHLSTRLYFTRCVVPFARAAAAPLRWENDISTVARRDIGLCNWPMDTKEARVRVKSKELLMGIASGNDSQD